MKPVLHSSPVQSSTQPAHDPICPPSVWINGIRVIGTEEAALHLLAHLHEQTSMKEAA